MTANSLEIKARKRQNPLAPADPSDFEFEEGHEIDPQTIVTNLLISLYCLDHANQRALFVETASGVDLSQAPFFYQAQYENTVNLFSVSYETIHQLAEDIPLDSRRLILVYSVGRAGSTLLGSALNAVDGVVGISEPDVFTQLVTFRDFSGSNEAEISTLVESCMKLQCKPTEQIPNPIAWAVKFRSFSIELGDLIHKHFPDAKNIFLYRHLESWTMSSMRAFVENEDNIEFRTGIQMWMSTLVPAIAKHVRENGSLLSFTAMGAQMWLAAMERSMDMQKNGVPMLAFRYEDISAVPQEAVKKVIEYCGFSNVEMISVYKALEQDSQAGSVISQEVLSGRDFKLTDTHREDIAQALAEHPTIHSSDFVVPSTWAR